MNVQAYKITRRGPKYFRMEHADAKGEPTGEPYRGPLMKREATGRDTPTGRYALQGYGLHPGFKDVIKATPEDVAKLPQLRLVLMSGSDESKRPVVHIPADWHTLSSRGRIELARKIAEAIGLDTPTRAREANKIIEDYTRGGKADTD